MKVYIDNPPKSRNEYIEFFEVLAPSDVEISGSIELFSNLLSLGGGVEYTGEQVVQTLEHILDDLGI